MNRARNIDQQLTQKLKEIEELDAKVRRWNLLGDISGQKLTENLQLEKEILELTKEESTTIALTQAEKLLEVMLLKQGEAAKALSNLQSKQLVHENDAINKILYKMDSEDIKFAIYCKIICDRKIEIYQEAADNYQAIVESLKGLLNLKSSEEVRQGKLLQLSKLMNSEFNQARVRAQLCYQECYKKILDLTRRMTFENAFDEDILMTFELYRMRVERMRKTVQSSRQPKPFPAH
jgi:hypothetical protein